MKLKYIAILFMIFLTVFLTVFFTGCMQEGAKEVKIGVVASMTGSASTTGRDIWESAVLAAEEINAKGGVYVSEYGRKVNITLVQGDDESTREGGQKAVSKLITQDNVDILVGGFSSAVVSAHQSIVAENGVPYIITGASSPIVTRRTDINTSTMFHYCPTTEDYGEKTILFVDDVVRNAINSRFNFSPDRPIRLALIVQDSPYGKGVQSAVEDTIRRRGLNIEVVANETFRMGETDFRTVLTSIKAAKPDVVYPATFLNEQIPLVTQARRDVGLNTIFLAVECNDDPDYYRGVGRFGEYSVIESRFGPYATPQGPLSSAIEKFRGDYQLRWGSPPSMMGVSTYEGVYIAARAIEKAGTLNKAKIVNALAELEMPEIVEAMDGGMIKFSKEYREAKFNLYMEQLIWNESIAELRPVIVWPDYLKTAEFVLPDWYTPGA